MTRSGVTLRFEGKPQWYKGKISQANPDGSYNVEYEDGESEQGLLASLIRLDNSDFQRGAKVEDLRITHTRPIVVHKDVLLRSEVRWLLVRAVKTCAAIRYRSTQVCGLGINPVGPSPFFGEE